MATEIASAYVTLQVKMDQLKSGMEQAKNSVKNSVNQSAVATAQATLKMQNLWAGVWQRAITVSRAIRRILIVTFAPMAAITAAAFKAFSKTSNAEVMVVMGQFNKFKDHVKSRLADAFYYAVKTTTFFGKTTAEWMDIISQKLNRLTQQDVKNFVSAMKAIFVLMTALKGFEMFAMLVRYLMMANIQLSRFAVNAAKVAKASAGISATGAMGGATGGVAAAATSEGGLIGAIAANTNATNLNTRALWARTGTGGAGAAGGLRNPWIASGAGAAVRSGRVSPTRMPVPVGWNAPRNYNFGNAVRGGTATAAATGAAAGVATSGLSRLLSVMSGFAKLTGIAAIIILLVSTFSKLYGFKDIANMFGTAINKIISAFKKFQNVVSAITDTLAAGMIGMAAIMHGIFTGKMFTAKGRAEVKRDAQMAIDEFLKSREAQGTPLASLPTQYMKSPKVQAEKIQTMANYAEKLRSLTLEKKGALQSDFGISRQKMSGKDIADNISLGMQDWQKAFAENQQKLIDIEAEKAKADKEFQNKMLVLTAKQYVTMQQATEEAEEMAGVLGTAGEPSTVF